MRASRSARRRGAVAARIIALCVLAEHAAAAQGVGRVDSSVADRAIAAGRLDVAERALYDAVARRPRQPSVRGALGMFLAGRGRLLVGATLLDEAVQFGADTAPIQRRQLEIYRWAGLHEAAASLRTAELSSPLREAMRRAAAAHPGGAAAATVTLEPGAPPSLGRIAIGMDSMRMTAEVEPLIEGVALPASAATLGAFERIGSHGDTVFVVARSIAIGAVTLGPVPVALVRNLDVARIGLDVLSLLTPTFDPVGRTMTVRSGTYVARGRRMAMLLTFPGVAFIARIGEPPVTLHSAAGSAVLRGRRWTLDVALGAIVVEP